jgi:multidrug efflux pump subunit AcrA (membrane-fusion protein)
MARRNVFLYSGVVPGKSDEERVVKHTRKSKAISAVILCFLVMFTGLIVHRIIQNRRAPGLQEGMPENRAGGAPNQAGPGGSPGVGSRNATAVRVTPVVLGTVENRVMINGDVLADTRVSIYPTIVSTGKLVEARFRIGDWVERGQVVAVVDPSRPGEIYSPSPVVSTISGTILSAPVNPGDTVSSATAVYVVGDLSGLSVETFVPERFSTNIHRGLAAQVSFEAIPEESFAAEVDEVSPVLDPASRTLRIRLRFLRRDPRIRAGMFATVSLITNSRIDVPVIPRSAIINTYGSWIVFVVNEDSIAERREISLGLGSETRIEVLEGLALGERVVTTGQNFLSHGETVRVVE